MEFDIVYDDDVQRHAVSTFVRHRLVRGFGCLGIMVILLLVGIAGYRLWLGDTTWLTGALVTFLLLLAIFFSTIWLMHRRLMRQKLHAIPSRRGRVRLDDAAITITTESATVSLSWDGFTEWWRLPRCWLLFVAPNNFVTLPLDGVGEEAKAAVAARLQHLKPLDLR